MKTDDGLLDKLVEVKPHRVTVTIEEMQGYITEAAQSGSGLVDLLVEKGIVKSVDVARAKAGQFGVEFVDLDRLEIPPAVIWLIPEATAQGFQVVPLETDGDTIRVATANPGDFDTIDGLQHVLNAQIEIKVASEEAVVAALRKYYPPPCDGGIEDVK